ncbi:hypothetical protein HNQ94_001547 [Salirhabdus euzebyi]|uniref:Putative zinc-finger domain-containing protein n=1 Tax=Salirhabdus euzebyi TaxID=394506 RepID=A0A841Q3W6_9BACI|nr:zf-HC2 domain-containing protein [Salirhabdus euzebyi]MBB6453099.1 hypothetical protein [Salirhabdus euzebyi]
MKLPCEVVRDLYPLYEENELSSEVRRGVDEHLDQCGECTALYKEEIGFQDIFQQEKMEELPPKKLDDKIRLRFKLRRMTAITFILLTIILVSIVNNYSTSREVLGDVLNAGVYRSVETYHHMVESVKEPGEPNFDFYVQDLFYDLQDREKFEDNLNFLEKGKLRKGKYSIYLEQSAFIQTLETLKMKHTTGTWDEVDKRTYERLEEYVKDFKIVLADHANKFRHGYSSYLQFVDINKFTAFYEKVNDLTYFYNRFHVLPEDMEPLSKEQLANNINEMLQVENEKVDFEEASPFNEPVGSYRFTVNMDMGEVRGVIDGYTGYVLSASVGISIPENQKDLSEEKLEEIAKQMLNAHFGLSNRYKMYSTFNTNSEHVVTFGFKPIVGEYEMYFPFEGAHQISIAKKTGQLDMFRADHQALLTPELFDLKPIVNINQEEAMDIVNQIAEEQYENRVRHDEEEKVYTYDDTGIVKSILTGKYVVAHVFKTRHQERIFINAENGEEEVPYFYFP